MQASSWQQLLISQRCSFTAHKWNAKLHIKPAQNKTHFNLQQPDVNFARRGFHLVLHRLQPRAVLQHAPAGAALTLSLQRCTLVFLLAHNSPGLPEEQESALIMAQITMLHMCVHLPEWKRALITRRIESERASELVVALLAMCVQHLSASWKLHDVDIAI